jgi:hypothetical protein
MLFHPILFLLLISNTSIVKCHTSKHNLFNISMGIANAQTVIICGLSMNIFMLFDLKQILMCPYVSIQENNIQLFDMNISKIFLFIFIEYMSG